MKKYFTLLLTTLMLSSMSYAQYYSTVTSRARHYLNLSVGAGISENMSVTELVSNKVGGTGQFQFTYEMDKKSFFFQFGVGVDYLYTGQGLAEMTDQYERNDKDGEPILYRYVYSDYKEAQHNILVTIPVMFGFHFATYGYVSAGAKVGLPVYGHYKTTTDMFTEGEYLRFVQPISKNVPAYGFYPRGEYSYSGDFDRSGIFVSPVFEIGGRFRIKKKIDCRLGLFAEYALPVGGSNYKANLIDLNQVDINPVSQNQKNLEENIRFNSILMSHFNTTVLNHEGENLLDRASQYLQIGVRATFRFDVTIPPYICVLCYD